MKITSLSMVNIYFFKNITIDNKNGIDEVITIMGSCVQSHTVTVNTDGTMDETIEFIFGKRNYNFCSNTFYHF